MASFIFTSLKRVEIKIFLNVLFGIILEVSSDAIVCGPRGLCVAAL